MNNIALSIVLFVVYFCFVSCAIYKPKTSVISPQEKNNPIEQEIEQMLDEIYEVAPSEQEMELVELPYMPIESAPQPAKGNKKLSGKAGGRGQEAEGIYPNAFHTKIGTTFHEQEFQATTEQSLLEGLSGEAYKPVYTPRPSASCHLPSLSSSKTSKSIDIAKLNLRHARVACGVLGIKQKVNDHDCNLAWMQAQINQQVKENPGKVSEVYKAIALKFSDVVIPSIEHLQARIA